MDGGVDLLLVETIFDTLNAKAAISAMISLMSRFPKRLPKPLAGPGAFAFAKAPTVMVQPF